MSGEIMRPNGSKSNSLTVEQATTEIDFCGARIIALWHGGKPHVVIRPIADALGLDWSAQLKRIKRDPVLSTSVVVMATQIPGDGDYSRP